ncbi:MAG: insulinase family protein [Spirochaetales bacterium]|nr:insulinase family protein [Spirochaetales bacterium]
MKKRYLAIFAAAYLLGVPFQATALDTPVPGLTWQVLDNGLEVFIYESHAVPLAKVEVVFRCGSLAQTPETAGLFHLYEHLLFKGNALLKSDSDFQAAMKELGVTSWNGGTSDEFVNYYFTIPSDKVEKGLAFWAAAVRSPLFLPNELAIEKDVVINEILGDYNEPNRIYDGALEARLFYMYPWRKDAIGPERNVRNATISQLREIQSTYYIPNNAAILVGGDVDPAEIIILIKKRFGDWKRGSAAWSTRPAPHPFPAADLFLAYPDETTYQDIITIDIRWRGPDVLDQTAATYAADLWLSLLEDPAGPFLNHLAEKIPSLYKKEATTVSYFTQRDGGVIYFRTLLKATSGHNLAQTVLDAKKAVLEEMNLMASDPHYFSEADFSLVKARLEDQLLVGRETADRFIDTLSFWWSTASTDYYFGYIDNLRRVTNDDVAKFITAYLLTKKSVTGVRLNPSLYRTARYGFRKARFSEITPANAFWWQDKGR